MAARPAASRRSAEARAPAADTLTLTCNRKSRTFEVRSAIISARQIGDETQWELALETRPDEEGLQLRLQLGPVPLPARDLDELLRAPLRVPSGYDRKREQHVGTVYAYEHEDLDRNVVRFLSRRGRSVHVRWTASCSDIEEYRERAKVLVDARFEFRGLVRQRARRSRILVVCPHEFQRDGERLFLKDSGFLVVAAGDVPQAVAIVDRGGCDLVYSLFLPATKAKRLVATLRARGYGGKILLICSKAGRAAHQGLPVDRLIATDGLDSEVALAAIRKLAP